MLILMYNGKYKSEKKGYTMIFRVDKFAETGLYSPRDIRTINLYIEDYAKQNGYAKYRLLNISDIGLRAFTLRTNMSRLLRSRLFE